MLCVDNSSNNAAWGKQRHLASNPTSAAPCRAASERVCGHRVLSIVWHRTSIVSPVPCIIVRRTRRASILCFHAIVHGCICALSPQPTLHQILTLPYPSAAAAKQASRPI